MRVLIGNRRASVVKDDGAVLLVRYEDTGEETAEVASECKALPPDDLFCAICWRFVKPTKDNVDVYSCGHSGQAMAATKLDPWIIVGGPR
jgi:hypothetical protein